MKCPKCGYVSHDYLDACRKCSTDLVTFKQDYRLAVVEPGELDLVATLSGTQESPGNSGEFNVDERFLQSQMLVEPEESDADVEADVNIVLDDDTDSQTITESETAFDLPGPEPSEVDAVFDLSASTESSLDETAFDMIDMSALEDLDADPAASLQESIVNVDPAASDDTSSDLDDLIPVIDFILKEDAPATPETVAADAARNKGFDETTLDLSQAGLADSAPEIDLLALPELEEPPGLEATDAASAATDGASEVTVVELPPTDRQDTMPAIELPPTFNLEEPAAPEAGPDITGDAARDALLTDSDQDAPDLDLPTIELAPFLEEENTPEPEVTIEADMAGDEVADATRIALNPMDHEGGLPAEPPAEPETFAMTVENTRLGLSDTAMHEETPASLILEAEGASTDTETPEIMLEPVSADLLETELEFELDEVETEASPPAEPAAGAGTEIILDLDDQDLDGRDRSEDEGKT
ncbi:hypothetical protein NKDENANG_03835 [Candidatus Entotheonellaceae bacterium PAL068K]